MNGNLPTGASAVAAVAGLSTDEVRQILVQVQRNGVRLNDCGGHVLHPAQGAGKFGPLPRFFVCRECGGRLSSGDASHYLRGYAHGLAYAENRTTYEDLLNAAVAADPLPAAEFP